MLPEKIMDVLESQDWNLCSIEEQGGEYYAEIEKDSPNGEDFIATIWFNGLPTDFIEKVAEYSDDYDADDHVIDLIECSGRGCLPGSLRDLIDDAEAIGEMLDDLAAALAVALDASDNLDEDYIRQNWEEVLSSDIDYSNIAHGIGWGFTHEDLETLMQLHKDGKYREKIEDLLTDCNFHSECSAWSDGDYRLF
jgi:hypothetical protein